MKSHLLAAVAASALLAGCATTNNPAEMSMNNPAAETAIPEGTGYFAKASDLPLHAPDFTKIADQLSGLLADTRKQINAVDVATLSKEWTATAKSFQALAESPEITTTFNNLNGAITKLSETLDTVDGAVAVAL